MELESGNGDILMALETSYSLPTTPRSPTKVMEETEEEEKKRLLAISNHTAKNNVVSKSDNNGDK